MRLCAYVCGGSAKGECMRVADTSRSADRSHILSPLPTCPTHSFPPHTHGGCFFSHTRTRREGGRQGGREGGRDRQTDGERTERQINRQAHTHAHTHTRSHTHTNVVDKREEVSGAVKEGIGELNREAASKHQSRPRDLPCPRASVPICTTRSLSLHC